MADRWTVVSIMPFSIREEKGGLFPGKFVIPAAPMGQCVTLVVGPSEYLMYVGDKRSVRLMETAETMAKSVVADYVTAKIGYRNEFDAGGKPVRAWPGLFCVEGEWTPKQIVEKFPQALQEARDIQNAWFKNLVEVGDDTWAKTRQHKAIVDEMRLACRSLGFEREWNIDIDKLKQLVPCPACEELISSTVMVCKHCKTIVKPKEWAASGLKQAV